MAPKAKKTKTEAKAKAGGSGTALNGGSENGPKETSVVSGRNLRARKVILKPETSIPIASVSTKKNAAHRPTKLQKPKAGAIKKTVIKSSRKSNAAVELDFLRSTNKGVVLTAGEGDIGQLGHGEEVLECQRPRLLNFKKSIRDICAGGMHTLLLTTDGEVYTFGCNDEYALGRDTSEEGSELTPGKVDLPHKIVQICAGDSHSAAITAHGKVYAWGNFRDSKGSMGFNPDGSMQKTPVMLQPNSTFTKICSGGDHLVLLASNGIPYTLGCAEQGQLGRVAPCFTERGGRKGIERLLSPSPIHTQKHHGEKILFTDIWASSHCTFAKAANGDIWVCGLNNYCQLALPSEIMVQYIFGVCSAFNGVDVAKISGGQHHTLMLDSHGRVSGFGRKEYGRLGLGKNSDDTKIPALIDTLVKHKIEDISCGVSTSFAVDNSGSVFSWGMSGSQLGHGNEINESDLWEPKQIVSKSLSDKKVTGVSSGGQHLVILAEGSNNTLNET